MRSDEPGMGAGLCALLAASLIGLATLAQAADSKGPPKLPEPLTKEAIRELVARLSDAEVRQLLMAQLDRAAVPAPPRSGGVMGMATDMEGHTERAVQLVRGAVELPQALAAVRTRFLEGRGPGHLLVVVLALLAMLAGGVLAERLVRRVIRLPSSIAEGPADHLVAQAGRLVVRLVLELVGLAAFVGGALVLFFALYQGHQPTRQLVLTYLAAVVLLRLVAIVSRLLLAPDEPARRLLPFDDGNARLLHAGVVRFTAVYVFWAGTVNLLSALGAPPAPVSFLMLLLAVPLLALALDTVWRTRAAVGALIRGPGEAGLLRRLAADLWPLLATAYFAVIVVARFLELSSGEATASRAPILSVVLVVVLPIVDMVLCRILGAVLDGRRPADGAGATFEPVLRRAIHVVVTVGGLLVLADLWDMNLFTLAERGLGGQVSGALLGIAITVLLAWILWQLARTVIDRKLGAEGGPVAASPGEEGGGQPASRLRTLLPLLRMLLLGAILVMATLSSLAALGVNILPLLAGAGVFGLAIGFGSQTLVRDVVSGAFYLMDDAFRLGEYIEAGDAKGTVEKIAIRSLHIRHHRGALNILPYGEIKRLRNTSRDWMIMTMEFRLPYDTDLLKVKKIIRRIGEELAADPELSREMLQPLKSQGVMATEDSALLVRAKFMAKPGGAPYLIRREAYQRILKAFAAEGIHFASRQVTVFVPGDQAAGAAAKEGVRAAAAGAVAGTVQEPPAPA